jgi:hypothetical protein
MRTKMKSNLMGKNVFWFVPSICTGFVNMCPTVFPVINYCNLGIYYETSCISWMELRFWAGRLLRLILTFLWPWARVKIHQQTSRISTISFIDSYKLDLHVSGDSFAHLQKHFDCIYIYRFVLLILLSLLYMFRATVSPIFRSTLYIQLFGTMYQLCCLLPTGDTDWMETIKQILLHLVGCWYHCTRDARLHQRQLQERFEVSNR